MYTIEDEIGALQGTIRLWSFLAEDGTREKEDYPDYEDIKHIFSECYLCELYIRVDGSCIGCPLQEAGHYCEVDISLWNEWAFGTLDLRKRAAKSIVKICEDALEELV